MAGAAIAGASAMATLLGTSIGNVFLGEIEDITKALTKNALLAEEKTAELSSKAINDLNQMKKEEGAGVSTLISIANSTGADMRIVKVHDYQGHVGKYPPPPNIGPGQVGVFLHTKTAMSMQGNEAVIIYRVITPENKKNDVMMGFDVSFNRLRDRKVYVDIADVNEWTSTTNWKTVRSTMSTGADKNSCVKDLAGLEARGSIGQNYSPICQFYIGYEPELLEEHRKKSDKKDNSDK